MKSKVKHYLLLSTVLLLCGCSAHNETKPTFTIAQLNDVYEIETVHGGKLGGLARVQTIVKELRKTNNPTFTIMAGDMLNPSAIGLSKVNGKRLYGKQMVDVLNHMKWDYFVLGNHEFDLKQDVLKARLNEMEFTTISDNVTDTTGKPFPNTQTCFIKDISGIKVGFLGITLNEYQVDYATISDPILAARKASQHLKSQGAQVLVAITHLSLKEDKILALEIPEIDIIIGGHEHEANYMKIGSDSTILAKADANAKSMFVHEFYYHEKSNLCQIKSRLVPITEKIKPDEQLTQVINGWKDIAFKSFKENGINPTDTVCFLKDSLNGLENDIRSKSTSLTRLITKSFMHAYPEAEAAVLNAGSIRIDDYLLPGPITEYDIMKVSPFGGTVSLVNIQGSALIKALNIAKNKVGSGAFLHYYNIQLEDSVWHLNTTPVQDDKQYKIAISSYLVQFGDSDLGCLTFDSGNVSKTKQENATFLRVVANYLQFLYPT